MNTCTGRKSKVQKNIQIHTYVQIHMTYSRWVCRLFLDSDSDSDIRSVHNSSWSWEVCTYCMHVCTSTITHIRIHVNTHMYYTYCIQSMLILFFIFSFSQGSTFLEMSWLFLSLERTNLEAFLFEYVNIRPDAQIVVRLLYVYMQVCMCVCMYVTHI